MLVLYPRTALMGTREITVEIFKPERQLIGIETLGTATKLRALQLLDNGFQALDFAVAMFDRGGDIANQAMQKCLSEDYGDRATCPNLLESGDSKKRLRSIRRWFLAVFSRPKVDARSAPAYASRCLRAT